MKRREQEYAQRQEETTPTEPARDPLVAEERLDAFLQDKTPEKYEELFGKFKHQEFVFGQLVFFMPAKTILKPAKTDNPLMPGVFLDYYTGPGGEFTGQYIVCELGDFASESTALACSSRTSSKLTSRRDFAALELFTELLPSGLCALPEFSSSGLTDCKLSPKIVGCELGYCGGSSTLDIDCPALSPAS